jgi:two-component system LytT family response regulator
MDYLLKPIDSDDFIGAIKRLKKRISASDTKAQIKMLLNNLKKEDHKKTIRIPNLDGFEIVEISDIIHCQAETSYTHIFTEHQKFMVSKGIKFYEDLLKDANFFRIHNSHLVNINHVKKYTKGKGGYVTMSNNSTIEVSTRKKEEFLKLFK